MRRVAVVLFAAIACSQAFLAQDVRSEDPKQRIKAAKDAVKAGTQGIERIKPLLQDPDVNVRIETVKAIVEIGSQYSLAPLLQALGDGDAEVQIRATDGLVNFYRSGYVKSGLSESIKRSGNAIKARFGIDEDEERIDYWIEVRPEVVSGIAKLLSTSQDLTVRANAARALGVLRGQAGTPALFEALRTKDTRLIFESLKALQKIRDPKSGPQVAFLFRDPEERVAVAALETAGLVRSVETLPDLAITYRSSSNARVKRAALGAMGMIGEAQNRDLFVQALNDKDDGIRAAAAEGLGRIKNPTDVPALQSCFDAERKMNTRLACAFAVVKNGNNDMSETSALRYLLNTLNSKSWRGVAEGYLVELARAKEVRTALETQIPSGTKDEKILLARLLATSGDKDSIKILEQLSRDSEPAVAQESIRALRNLRARLP